MAEKKKLPEHSPAEPGKINEILGVYSMKIANGSPLPLAWLMDSLVAGEQMPYADYGH
jgi:hypothetical protein